MQVRGDTSRIYALGGSFISHEKESKKLFSYHVEQNTFFHKNNTLTQQIQQRNIFFLAGDRINFFFSYNAKSNFFSVS